MKVAEKFEVDYVQVLDEQGNIIDSGSLPGSLPDDVFKEKYMLMKFLRAFDNKAVSLQRQGRMGTYSEFKGQEAIQVGAMMALKSEDWFFPTYRDTAAIIARGVPAEKMLLYWSGDERGQEFPENVNVFPIAIPVSSQIPHAAGAALALKYKKSSAISLVTVGDGGTSKADFYEALNIAGVFNLPLVCLIENNQYAISLPRKQQSASETLAQKGLSFGFRSIQVDGNDLLAVYSVVRSAAERARKGEGPSLVECLTYRLGHHTTATGDEPYKSEEEIEKWKRRDPIERLRRYLENRGLWTEEWEEEVNESIKKDLDSVVKKFESIPRPRPEDVFSNVYFKMPAKLKRQQEELSKFVNAES